MRLGWPSQRSLSLLLRKRLVYALSMKDSDASLSVISDFIRFPSSAPLWAELCLSIVLSVMWLVCAILNLPFVANAVLSFIIFGSRKFTPARLLSDLVLNEIAVCLYTFFLMIRTWLFFSRGGKLWSTAVHNMGAAAIKLGDNDNDSEGCKD
jgi:hypothetical protein